MTEDIYIGQKKSNVGCLLVILLIVGVSAGIHHLVRMRRSKAPAEEQSEPAIEESVTAVEGANLDPGLTIVAKARRLMADGDLLGVREKAHEVLEQSTNPVALQSAIELLGDVNIELVLSPRNMPEKTEYTVHSGDSLGALAGKFNTTIAAIQKGNRITGSIIKINDRLRIFSGEFSIKVDKSDNILDLYLNSRLFKRYPVGTGEFGRTPVGDFKITEKIAQPTWWKPDGKAVPYGDTNNVLGTHWLSLDIPGYGLHGTWEPDTVGTQASAGCTRLLNDDIEELYILVPDGTPVRITD